MAEHGIDSVVQARSLFEAFSVEVQGIHRAWTLWERMMQPDDPGEWAGDLYKRTAPEFFGVAQFALLTCVVQALARLGDPNETLGHANLTLERVLLDAPPSKRQYVVAAAEQAAASVKKIIEDPDLRDLRNQRISHNDLHVARGQATADLHIEKVRLGVMHLLDLHAVLCTATDEGPFRIDTGEGYSADRTVEEPWRAEIERLNYILRLGLTQDVGHRS